MHLHINHKCIAHIFKCDYPLQLFHKNVLYSLTLENKFFSIPGLQNSRQVALPIFYYLWKDGLKGGGGEGKLGILLYFCNITRSN